MQLVQVKCYSSLQKTNGRKMIYFKASSENELRRLFYFGTQSPIIRSNLLAGLFQIPLSRWSILVCHIDIGKKKEKKKKRKRRRKVALLVELLERGNVAANLYTQITLDWSHKLHSENSEHATKNHFICLICLIIGCLKCIVTEQLKIVR